MRSINIRQYFHLTLLLQIAKRTADKTQKMAINHTSQIATAHIKIPTFPAINLVKINKFEYKFTFLQII